MAKKTTAIDVEGEAKAPGRRRRRLYEPDEATGETGAEASAAGDAAMHDQREVRSEKAQILIERNALISAGATLIMPIPGADLAALTLIQIDMLADLAKIYEVDYLKERRKTYLAALVSSVVPVSGGRVLRSTVKWIPVVGSAIAAAFLPAAAGGATYATGKIFQKHFARGGELLDFEASKWREYGEEQYVRGKKLVADVLKKGPEAVAAATGA